MGWACHGMGLSLDGFSWGISLSLEGFVVRWVFLFDGFVWGINKIVILFMVWGLSVYSTQF